MRPIRVFSLTGFSLSESRSSGLYLLSVPLIFVVFELKFMPQFSKQTFKIYKAKQRQRQKQKQKQRLLSASYWGPHEGQLVFSLLQLLSRSWGYTCFIRIVGFSFHSDRWVDCIILFSVLELWYTFFMCNSICLFLDRWPTKVFLEWANELNLKGVGIPLGAMDREYKAAIEPEK